VRSFGEGQPYDVRVVTFSGEHLVSPSGTARLNDRVTSLQVIANVSSALPGPYTLQVHKADLGWNSYQLVL